ncbi:MAG: mannose-1-phosphate guanylyltransferase [Saprospiraceae bacterium]|nr:mannose-1-phosphate guanylyltransferase [Saprospiraceae bacterium]
MSRYIAIMAGGIGSRFWPSSTTDRPKQFLDILGVGKSLIRMTFERVLPLCPAEQIMVLTNKKYKALVMEHLPELPKKNILCEPSMNNTAPCIAYMALKIGQRDPEASFAVLPSDHVILKEDIYRQKLDQAFLFAENNDALVTLGISPTRPDTGYGYINYIPDAIKEGVCKVAAFKEKPDEAQAQKYLASGQYLWNAGMFVWSVRSILASFRKNASEVMDVLSKDISAYNTDREQAYIDEVYPDTENISIDYAILERADNVYTLPSDIGWSDLGTWSSLHAYMSDKTDQVTIGSNIHLINSNNIIVMSNNDKTIVINGLQDYIVVDEDHALMIYPKSDEQEIKEVVKRLS